LHNLLLDGKLIYGDFLLLFVIAIVRDEWILAV